jgi:hypothetical protein
VFISRVYFLPRKDVGRIKVGAAKAGKSRHANMLSYRRVSMQGRDSFSKNWRELARNQT